MKKNIGNVLALYPTPAVVVGTEVNGKVNWLLVAHVGIIGHDQIMLSLFKKHYTNEGVKQTGKVSVNIVNEAMLERADYVGCTSGAKADKSDVFVYHMGEAGTPVINENAPVSGKHTERRNSNENTDIGKRRTASVRHRLGLHGIHAKLSPVSRPQGCDKYHP